MNGVGMRYERRTNRHPTSSVDAGSLDRHRAVHTDVRATDDFIAAPGRSTHTHVGDGVVLVLTGWVPGRLRSRVDCNQSAGAPPSRPIVERNNRDDSDSVLRLHRVCVRAGVHRTHDCAHEFRANRARARAIVRLSASNTGRRCARSRRIYHAAAVAEAGAPFATGIWRSREQPKGLVGGRGR